MRLWPALPLGSTITWKDGHKTEVAGACAPATSVSRLPAFWRFLSMSVNTLKASTSSCPSSWRHPSTGVTGDMPTELFPYASMALSSTSSKRNTR